MNCKECTKRRCPSFGSSEKCNVCLYTGGDYLEVRDWLADVAQPQADEAFDCVEVRFKNGRKGFYRNVNRLPLSAGDIVAVESSPGHDIGCVMLTGQLARLQMRRKKEDPSSPELRKVYRLATQKDIDVWQTAIAREQKTLVRTREICDNLGLVMKLSDVEYQGDNLKATFYYTADGRVDFRQLIKELASAFGVRIEMRQIGLRQEAARVGGIGSCGRELCCTTWLTDFRSVNTSAARTQRLSLNPQKLAGQCGKLKCCLNFELDVYVDALKGFPPTDAVLRTEKGVAHFQKMDVFKGIYWYAYDFEAMNWIGLHVDAVAEIQQANRRGEKPESLEMYVEESERPRSGSRREETSELQAVEEGEITRFDKVSSRRSRRRGDRRREDRRRESVPEVKNGAEEAPSGEQKAEKASATGEAPQGERPARRGDRRRGRDGRTDDNKRKAGDAACAENPSATQQPARTEENASSSASRAESSAAEGERNPEGGRQEAPSGQRRGNNRRGRGRDSRRDGGSRSERTPNTAAAENASAGDRPSERTSERAGGAAGTTGQASGERSQGSGAAENASQGRDGRRGRGRDGRRRGNRRPGGSAAGGENSASGRPQE